MSAHQGDSSPDVFVFPPFAPPVRRADGPPPLPAAPAAEAPVDSESYTLEVPLPAHDVGDAEVEEEPAAALPWELPAEPTVAAGEPAAEDQDLPWLEMPDGGPTIHATDEAPAAPANEGSGAWMDWEGEAAAPGVTAAEITPPPLAMAGELTSVSAVPSAAAEPFGFDEPAAEPAEPVASTEPFGFVEPAYEPVAAAEPAPSAEAHAWPVEAMEPAALQAADAAPTGAAPAAPDAAAVHTPAVDHAAFSRVAERLEAAARALRTDPGGFVATNHDDPLALLVVGYALGYRQASGE